MNACKRMTLLLIASLILLLGAGTASAQGEAGRSLGAVFTYQGRLTDGGGAAVSGSCDFNFNLYDALNGGTQIAGPLLKTDVPVDEGYFTASLDFGSPAFDGMERWLDIAVRCPAGSGTYTQLSPRQAVTAAPYATYASLAGNLAWGSGLSGSTGTGLSISGGEVGLSGSGSSRGLYGIGTATSGFSDGVYGESGSDSGSGVVGVNTNTTSGVGVYGEASSSNGRGVFGYNLDGVAVYGESASGRGVYGTSNNNDGVAGKSITGSGVYGESQSGTGLYGSSANGVGVHGDGATYGVHGDSPNRGVFGSTTSGYGLYGLATDPDGFGVFGWANAGTGYGLGVYGRSDSIGGRGVYGYATATSGNAEGVIGRSDSDQGYGVEGYVTATSGHTYGVFGQAFSPQGYGVYGTGPVTGTMGIATADSGYAFGVFGKATASPAGYGGLFMGTATGVEGWGHTGVYGVSTFSGGSGGAFYNADNAGIALVAESRNGNIFEGYSEFGGSTSRRFYIAANGNVYADGTYTSPAADYAEMLPGAEGLQPGDLLAIGPDGQLVKTTSAYQPSVAGVYSTQPGFVGGASEDTSGKIPLAMVGVVPVRVCAENGPILPGDLLTASSTPGCAMKASPLTLNGVTFYPSGVIVGKALESLESGEGLVLVLVTLQ